MCLPRNSAPFLPPFSRHSLRFASTSRIPTVIWVGRRSVMLTGLRSGSRTTTMGCLLPVASALDDSVRIEQDHSAWNASAKIRDDPARARRRRSQKNGGRFGFRPDPLQLAQRHLLDHVIDAFLENQIGALARRQNIFVQVDQIDA